MLYFYGLPEELPSGVIVSGAGEADGIGTAPGIGQAQVNSVGTATGVGTAPGIGLATSGAKTVVGWFDEWDRRQKRRIPVEQLREILKAQGSRWADELADTYQVAEKRLESPKTKKHQQVLEEVLERVSERVAPPANVVAAPLDWSPVIAAVRAAAEATRATLAIKKAEEALRALRDEDEEDAEILMQWFMYG